MLRKKHLRIRMYIYHPVILELHRISNPLIYVVIELTVLLLHTRKQWNVPCNVFNMVYVSSSLPNVFSGYSWHTFLFKEMFVEFDHCNNIFVVQNSVEQLSTTSNIPMDDIVSEMHMMIMIIFLCHSVRLIDRLMFEVL